MCETVWFIKEKKIPLYLWTHETRKQIRCSEIQCERSRNRKIVTDVLFQKGEKGRKKEITIPKQLKFARFQGLRINLWGWMLQPLGSRLCPPGLRLCPLFYKDMWDQIANLCWIIEKAREFQKISISSPLTTLKPLTVITTNCWKFWKRWEYQTTLPASWETCMQVKKY